MFVTDQTNNKNHRSQIITKNEDENKNSLIEMTRYTTSQQHTFLSSLFIYLFIYHIIKNTEAIQTS